jgi:hypothetical protein
LIFTARDSTGRAPCANCHREVGGRAIAGGLVLLQGRGYSSLVNAPSANKPGAIRVIPGDPENSYLIHKLEGRSGIVGDRMPRVPPYLSENQILVIKRWIELGAPAD